MDKDTPDFDDLFEPFELDDGPPPEPERPDPGQQAQAAATQSTVSDVATVACPSCGSSNPDYNRHCEQCGARLSQDPLPVAPPPSLRTSPGGRALGVLAAVILLVALAALAFNIFSGDTPDTTSTTTSSTTIPVAATELFAASVEASSFLPGWEPENLIDGDPSTHWNDESLHGIGAWLTFRFADPVSITEIELQNLLDDEKFKRNYKIQGYLITTDDLSVEFSGRLDNLDGSNPQRVPIASLGTRELTIQVMSTYPAESAGDKPPFDELALLSVRFFGNEIEQ